MNNSYEQEELIYDEEIVNPVLELIRRYDNFEREKEKRYKALKKDHELRERILKRKILLNKYKFAYKPMIYGILFICVSLFKMSALYSVTDLNIELRELEMKILEMEKVVTNLEDTDKTLENDISLSRLERESKRLGFTDDTRVEYVKF